MVHSLIELLDFYSISNIKYLKGCVIESLNCYQSLSQVLELQENKIFGHYAILRATDWHF